MLEVTKEELIRLPQWARVAFAARCARRVGGLFEFYWIDASKKDFRGIKRAIAVAEASARLGERDDDAAAACTYAYTAADRARAAISRKEYADAAHAVAYAAADAAYAAFVLADTNAHAGYADRGASPLGCGSEVCRAQRYDFLMLKRSSEIHSWDDDTPVPPEICGPIWPEGIPEKWPLEEVAAINSKIGRFADLQFDLPPDVDDEAAQYRIRALIRELYEKLNDHHVSHGGSGLVLDNFVVFEPQSAEVT